MAATTAQALDLVTLVQAHEPALRRLARAYAGATGEQDDLYQEMLLQLWRSYPSFQGASAPGTWLYRVALNTGLTWRRRTQRRPAPHEIADAHLPPTGAGRSEAAILEDFMASLDPADRSVLLLYMEGLPNTEIAEVTGFTAGAVGVRIHRMKQAFTARYVERGGR